MAKSPKMTAARRKLLKPSQSGLPGEKEYPLDTPGRARNAKARASQQVNRGSLSPAQEKKIGRSAGRSQR